MAPTSYAYPPLSPLSASKSFWCLDPTFFFNPLFSIDFIWLESYCICMNRLFSKSGFSGKELLFALGSISLLCILSVPTFFHLQTRHRESDLKLTIEQIENHLKSNEFQNLDSSQANQPCETCFTELQEAPTRQTLWYKVSNTIYLFSLNGNQGQKAFYEEKGDFKIEVLPEEKRLRVTQF